MTASASLQPSRPRPRDLGLWPAIAALACLAVALIVYWFLQQPPPNRNTLAIGPQATAERVAIELQAPQELDSKSKAEVLELRTEAVWRYPELLAADYAPSETVFGQLADARPWWGMEGQYRHGPGEASLTGPAEESRFILNPYLLVAADFYGRPEPPFSCLPVALAWQPAATRADAVYAADCVAGMPGGQFDLIAYNARDLNLNFVYVAYEDSLNIAHPDPPTEAYAIPHYLHLGNSCGYPGGCNNMSPASPEIDGLRVTGLPARAVVRLWPSRPASPDQTPAFVFVLRFE